MLLLYFCVILDILTQNWKTADPEHTELCAIRKWILPGDQQSTLQWGEWLPGLDRNPGHEEAVVWELIRVKNQHREKWRGASSKNHLTAWMGHQSTQVGKDSKNFSQRQNVGIVSENFALKQSSFHSAKKVVVSNRRSGTVGRSQTLKVRVI